MSNLRGAVQRVKRSISGRAAGAVDSTAPRTQRLVASSAIVRSIFLVM